MPFPRTSVPSPLTTANLSPGPAVAAVVVLIIRAVPESTSAQVVIQNGRVIVTSWAYATGTITRRPGAMWWDQSLRLCWNTVHAGAGLKIVSRASRLTRPRAQECALGGGQERARLLALILTSPRRLATGKGRERLRRSTITVH